MNSTMSNNQEIFGFGNHQTTQGAYGGTYGNTSPTNIEILKNTGRIKITKIFYSCFIILDVIMLCICNCNYFRGMRRGQKLPLRHIRISFGRSYPKQSKVERERNDSRLERGHTGRNLKSQSCTVSSIGDK